ncbi:ABC transporter ATP-binding protein [Abyssisolibacter fermentans]|uniref:ABC transporter ATP-binding protein n=1 Tax=Abyssisolibacter fermentans TaxID=1766203 RepID=UPI00082A0DF6|nr:ABC transporter ATP-binding protein [Abyssisolibacter fermentans]
MDRILEVKNLRVSFHTYAGEVQAVRDISFNLKKGETLAIVGESGCGKTVTAKSLMKLITIPPGEMKKGSEINLFGEIKEAGEIKQIKEDVLKMNKKRLKLLRGGDISMIFQDPMTSLNPTMKIGHQISESLEIHSKINKKEGLKKAVELLRLVNIPNPEKRAKEYPHQFSGGMRQRAMIAIALACNPRILIADEPTTALDVTIQAQIMNLIKELQQKSNTSVILVTHDLGVVANVADRIMVMYAGKIIERGTKREIFYNPQHPYTWALLKSVPRLDIENKSKLYSLKGTPPDLIKPPVGCPFVTRCEYCMPICREALPEDTTISGTHSVSCWLKHENAPKIDRIKIAGGVI